LPALLTIAGRRGFWPRRRLIAYAPGEPSIARQGIWRRFGDHVLRRPGAALGITVAFFAAGGARSRGLPEGLQHDDVLQREDRERERLSRCSSAPSRPARWPPSTVLVQRRGGPVRAADVLATQRRLATVHDVAGSVPTGQRSRDGPDRRARRGPALGPVQVRRTGGGPAIALGGPECRPGGDRSGRAAGSAINYDYSTERRRATSS